MNLQEQLFELKIQIDKNKQMHADLIKMHHELDLAIREKEINAMQYSERDLYDFAMRYLWPKYHSDKRLDIIEDWAREEVKKFKEQKNAEAST